MFRLLWLVACLLFAGCATTNNTTSYVRVTGTGATETLALQEAFKKAVEDKTGVLVLSERETMSLKLVKNDILAYSSGYVDNFKIISADTFGNKVYLTVDVWVSDSKIKNRILAESKSIKDFDGPKHSVQYGTYLNSRESGDKILNQILSDYPVRAFNVTQSPYKIELDSDRNAIVKVPFKFVWNYNYMESLNDALKRIQDVSSFASPHQGYIITIVKKPGEYFGTQNRYYFNDMTVLRRINTVLDGVTPMIKIRALTRDRKPIIESCVNPKNFLNGRNGEKFVDIKSNNTFLVGNTQAVGTILLTIPPHLNHLFSNMHHVELEVVSHYKC